MFLLWIFLIGFYSGLSHAQGTLCKSKYGTKCLTREDPGADIYFDYFKWNSTCFAYQDGRYCMIRLGYLQLCECPGAVSFSEGNPELRCDSSSVNDNPQECSEQKNVYCPLTMNKDGQEYQNTLCSYCGEDKEKCQGKICESGIMSQEEKDDIVRIHNDYRSKVSNGEEKRGVGGPQPSAANMNTLHWDEDLAKGAQMWALQCPTEHDVNRLTPEFNNYPYSWVGQNLAYHWSSDLNSSRDYRQMISSWYDEVADFPPENVESYSEKGSTGVTGHYTMMVWAATTKIGCGFIHHYDYSQPNHPYKKTLVCNYGKGGNILGQEVYLAGEPGSACRNGIKKSLCS